MKQGKRSIVLFISNLVMMFMLLGTAVYAFVWNKELDTNIDITVGTEETLTITKDIGNQNENLKLIPQNAQATHEDEKKELVYTVEITLENDLGQQNLEAIVTTKDHLDVNVDIVKDGNVWTATITVKLNETIKDTESFNDIKDGPHNTTINFTLIPTED